MRKPTGQTVLLRKALEKQSSAPNHYNARPDKRARKLLILWCG